MLAAARGGRCVLSRLLKVSPGRKQAQASLLTFLCGKERRSTSLPLPSLDIPLPFLRRLNALPHSTLGDDDAYQDKVDPVSLVAEELACLASNLRMRVTADILNVPSLANAAEYFFKLGVEGKRFRPMVLMLMASSLNLLPSPTPDLKLGVDDRRIRQYRVAEITEMIHVATLVHDDVVDQSDSRRGISSLNHNIGNKLAVLAGDFLLAKASIGLSTLRNGEVMALVSETLEHLATGEFMQLAADTQQSCSMEYYLQKTYLKTASLMANSCKSIALLADQPREVAMLAFDYGRHLGLAYQLVDDALDFKGTSATLGKPALADLREAVKLVKKTRGVAKTLELAAKHAQQAESAIAQFPPCSDSRSQQCRQALADLTHSVVKRSM
ncbi:hypothetical protein KC19_6G050600 [Ceratodon purpureus]|uniref:Uncharacterized protein n=3 Tax=Ceratodon purpureus TaxID=3225 RepID=A0A8T0HF82_CERPU|nr:hypothetical protein KC19_6G050600 [Ceratodon purpureus]